MILIGSTAIKQHYPDFPREPKDKDYIIYEHQNFQWNSNRETEYLHNKVISDLYHKTGKEVIEPNHLTTLKASHLCWNINWDKHMFDLQFLLKKGCLIDKDLFWKLYDFWNVYHGKNKRSDLKMSKDEFFDNAINYNEHEHDYLHTIINPVPVYTLILKDGKDVELDEIKYERLTKEQKLQLIREEVMVMAYERFKHLPYKIAYNRMLKKFIMNHAPKFSLLFILENYIELTKINFNYINQIHESVQTIK